MTRQGEERTITEAQPGKKRLLYLDILRMTATVAVIGVHTVSLGTTMVTEHSGYWYGFEIANYLFLCCNLLFIMISGALLLPVRGESAGTFYRKRFVKVCVPMVVYYILYVCAKEGICWIFPDHWLALFKRILTGAPEEAPHFWLVYVILWLYVLTPVLRYLMQHIPDSVLGGLMAVILVFQTVVTYSDACYGNPVLTGMLDSFAGVFLLGYFLTRGHTKRFGYLVLGTGAVSVVASVCLILSGRDYYRYIFNNAPLMVFYAMAVFWLVKWLFDGREQVSRFTRIVSRYSFGILLIHWGVLHYLVKQVFGISPLMGGGIGGSLLMMLLTLLFSLAGAVALDKTVIAWVIKAVSAGLDALAGMWNRRVRQ